MNNTIKHLLFVGMPCALCVGALCCVLLLAPGTSVSWPARVIILQQGGGHLAGLFDGLRHNAVFDVTSFGRVSGGSSCGHGLVAGVVRFFDKVVYADQPDICTTPNCGLSNCTGNCQLQEDPPLSCGVDCDPQTYDSTVNDCAHAPQNSGLYIGCNSACGEATICLHCPALTCTNTNMPPSCPFSIVCGHDYECGDWGGYCGSDFCCDPPAPGGGCQAVQGSNDLCGSDWSCCNYGEQDDESECGLMGSCGSNGCCLGAYTPIIIDVKGDGYSLTSAVNGVEFDMAGAGKTVQIAWTSAGSDDAFLALDRNGNGRIDDGTELFGNYTPQPAPGGGLPKNGWNALAVYDQPAKGGNGDGWIDAQDAIYSKLLLWVDKNHNGKSEPHELFTLRQLGIARICLSYTSSTWTDAFGNVFRYRSSVVHQNPYLGQQDAAYDVLLQTQKRGKT